MQFDNTPRLTDLQKENVALIEDYLQAYVGTSRYAKSVSCETAFERENYICDFILECDGFFAVLQYDSFQNISASLDIKLVYYGCDYRFSVYDIFNLFDISDFKRYYYEDCIDADAINNILGELTGLIDKYGFDFRNAGSGTKLKKLKENFEADQLVKNGEEWRDSLENTESDYTHIKWLKTSAATDEKLISKLEKRADSLCIYEKRLLEYLKQGNAQEKENNVSGREAETFKKVRRIVMIPIAIVSVLITSGIELLLYSTILKDAYIPNGENFTEFEIPIPFNKASIVLGCVFLFAFLSRVIGRPLVKKLVPDYAKKYVEATYNPDKLSTTKAKISNNIILPAVIFVMSAVLLVGANTGVAFYDEYVVNFYISSDYHHYSYDEVELYTVNCEDNDGSCYAVSFAGEYYIFENCKEGSRTDLLMKKIAYRYSKSINAVEDEDELAELVAENTTAKLS